MEERVRKAPARVWATVAVDGGVEITLVMEADGGEGAVIWFGHDGPDVIMDFADVDSLERLAAAAADGARQLQERISANRAAASNGAADLLVGTGVSR